MTSRILRAELAFLDDEWVADGAITVDGDLIVDAGPAAEVIARTPAAAVEQLADAILLPGGVNGHGHTFQALVRGFGDDLPFGEWMGSLVHPTAARLDETVVSA